MAQFEVWIARPSRTFVNPKKGCCRKTALKSSVWGSQPTKREQEATEKKPKAPTKRSLKDEQELEREDRAQKTERLRKLRLAKEAADREKNPSSNGRDEAQHAIKEWCFD
jgi:hypothetical protein